MSCARIDASYQTSVGYVTQHCAMHTKVFLNDTVSEA